MKHNTRNIILALFTVALLALSACGTGKGCDCPSFGQATTEAQTDA